MDPWAEQEKRFGTLSVAEPQQTQQRQPQKKVGGIRGAIASLLPLIGGGLGAVGGSFVAPVAGTAAGGAAGSAAGEALKEKLLGENLSAGNIAEQGVLGAVPGALGAASKGIKALKGVKAAEDVASTLPKARHVENILTQGEQMQARPLGISAGNKAIGKELTPQDSARMLDVLKREKISTTNANNAMRDLTDRKNLYGKQISSFIEKNNAPLSEAEKKQITSRFLDNLPSSDPLLQKKALVLANDFEKQVSDTKGLWKFRQKMDSIIPETKQAAGSAALTKEQAAGRTFRQQLADELGNVPGMSKYHDLSEVGQFIGKGARELNQPGGGLIGRVLSSGPVQAAESRLGKITEKGARLAGASGEAPTATVAEKQLGLPKALLQQGITRAVGQPLLSSGTQDQVTPDLTGTASPATPSPLDQFGQEPAPQLSNTSPFSQENIQSAILGDIERTGGKNVNTLISLYKTFGDQGAGTQKPLSAEASKVVSNANIGLQALDDFEKAVSTDPSVLNKRVIPGRGILGGIGGRALGTTSIDAAANQIIDVLARLRTGAAISKEEEARFKQFIPTAGDTPESAAQKISYLRNQFEQVANQSGSAGTDVQSQLQALGVGAQ